MKTYPAKITVASIKKVVDSLRRQAKEGPLVTFKMRIDDFKALAKAAGWTKKQIARYLK